MYVFALILLAVMAAPAQAELQVKTDNTHFYLRETNPPYHCLRWSVNLGHMYFPTEWTSKDAATTAFNWPSADGTATCLPRYTVKPYGTLSTTRPLYEVYRFVTFNEKVQIGRVANHTECYPKILLKNSRAEYHEVTNSDGLTGVAVCSVAE